MSIIDELMNEINLIEHLIRDYKKQLDELESTYENTGGLFVGTLISNCKKHIRELKERIVQIKYEIINKIVTKTTKQDEVIPDFYRFVEINTEIEEGDLLNGSKKATKRDDIDGICLQKIRFLHGYLLIIKLK